MTIVWVVVEAKPTNVSPLLGIANLFLKVSCQDYSINPSIELVSCFLELKDVLS